MLRDIRPDGQVHLTIALANGNRATVVQPATMLDDPAVWEALDQVEVDHLERQEIADRALAV